MRVQLWEQVWVRVVGERARVRALMHGSHRGSRAESEGEGEGEGKGEGEGEGEGSRPAAAVPAVLGLGALEDGLGLGFGGREAK